MKKSRLQIVVGALVVVGLGGCTWFSDPVKSNSPAVVSNSAQKPAAEQNYFVVKPDFTPLYRTGPQQPNGPDQSLPKGTLVTLLQRNFGFSRVQLENGLNGYVATEDLEVAPPERLAPAQPVFNDNTRNNSAIVQHFSAEKAEKSAAVSTGNAEAVPDLPEPRLEPEPADVAKPEFRY